MFPTYVETVLSQIFEPVFYDSIILLTISFICVTVLLKYYHFLGGRKKSIMYLIRLMIPVILMALFHAGTRRLVMGGGVAAIAVQKPEGVFPADHLPPFPLLPPSHFFARWLPILFPVTGIVCSIGLTLAIFFFATMILFGDKIAAKVFHVVVVTPDEYRSLQKEVNEISQKLAIPTPKIGVIEDLRPNAFTIGYGHRAILVFSIGILNILSEGELVAVASHELAHIKNRDFFFKTLSHALVLVSFFNPLAYVTASAAQREREIFADERGAKLLEQPRDLARALAKICKALQTVPKEGPLARLTSSLFLVSPVARRLEILAAHPRPDQRVRNIARLTSKPTSVHRNVGIGVALSLLTIFGGIATSCFLINIRTSFMQNHLPLIPFHQHIDRPRSDLMLNPRSGNILPLIPLHVMPPHLEYATGPVSGDHVSTSRFREFRCGIRDYLWDRLIFVSDPGVDPAVPDVNGWAGLPLPPLYLKSSSPIVGTPMAPATAPPNPLAPSILIF